MKYLKTFEISIHDQKQNLEREIFNFLKYLETEYNIYFIDIENEILYTIHRNNKIDRITPVNNRFSSDNLVFSTISTLKNRNSISLHLIDSCTLVQMNKVFEYLVTKYTQEYEEYLISNDINKYNL